MIEMTISESDKNELQHAKILLENPGIAAKITNFIGKPIESLIEELPKGFRDNIDKIIQAALQKAMQAALLTIKDEPGKTSSNRLHKVGVALTGAAGGFFGLAALGAELPLSTTIILRSIAEIGRSHGESISSHEAKLACIEVLAFGGKSESDDGTETGYYTVRGFLAKSLSEAAKHVASEGFTSKGAPAILNLLTKIAQRFGIQVTNKLAAQSVPVVGAAGGAVVNTIFINHFQDMATGHFIVRKLERKYGKDLIKQVYEQLPNH